MCGGESLQKYITVNNLNHSLHKPLNRKQTYILQLTHKFRFVTGPLLAKHRGKSLSSTNAAVNILYKQGYLGRHYDDSYKLLNKPASYTLRIKEYAFLGIIQT